MTRFLRAALAALCLAAPVLAQTPQATGPGGALILGTISGTGPVGPILSFYSAPSSPSNYTIAWRNTGTAATTCSLEVQGSLDGGVTWINITAATDCTPVPPASTAAVVVQNTPFPMLRVVVLAYAQGDATTAITVGFARGNQ